MKRLFSHPADMLLDLSRSFVDKLRKKRIVVGIMSLNQAHTNLTDEPPHVISDSCIVPGLPSGDDD